MKPKKIRVGVIGIGTMGAHHARAYSLLPQANLVGVADPDFERASKVARVYGAKAFSDYNALLKEVESLSLVTPTETHYEIGMVAIRQGIHLLIEKPLCLKVDEGKELVQAAQKKGVLLATGHIERFNPAFRGLQELIKSQKVLSISAQRFSPYPERITDASVVLDMMIHDLDLVLSLAGSPLQGLEAKGQRIKSSYLDQASVKLTFQNGLTADIQANRVFGEKTRNFKVIGEEISFDLDLLHRRLGIHKPSGLQEVFVQNMDQLEAELKNFIDCVSSGKPPLVSGEDGLAALELALEIERVCQGGSL